MSITDELREFTRLHTLANDAYRDRLLAIADRIDAEVDRLCDVASEYAYDIGFDDGWQAAMDELDDQPN